MKMIRMLLAVVTLSACAVWSQDFGPWSPPVNLGPAINSNCDDQHPALSKDGLSLVFSSTRPLTPGQPCLPALHLWVAQRDSLDSEWQTPQPMTQVNGSYTSSFQDHAPNLTTDGHWLFFHSSRPSGCNSAGGRQELWAAHRKDKRDDFGWEAPVNLGCVLNLTNTDDAGANVWQDGSTGTFYMYFTRNLTPSDPNGFKIYVTTCTAELEKCVYDQLWDSPIYVSELNFAGARDTRTAIRRRDGLEMLISSNRTGTAGGLDLWVSTRSSVQDLWSIPVDLNVANIENDGGPLINTISNDSAPALSWDGQTVVFWSNRPGGYGFNDLYVSTRAKGGGN